VERNLKAAMVDRVCLLEERPQTNAGWRVIAVPPNVVKILQRRMRTTKLRTEVAIFPSPIGRVRDSSNTAADLRRSLDDAGFDWVSSHTFRKTVATRLDGAGLSARAIGDHLGHAQPSMTQDVYMGRRVASSDAANVLDR
jgi:integrase